MWISHRWLRYSTRLGQRTKKENERGPPGGASRARCLYKMLYHHVHKSMEGKVSGIADTGRSRISTPRYERLDTYCDGAIIGNLEGRFAMVQGEGLRTLSWTALHARMGTSGDFTKCNSAGNLVTNFRYCLLIVNGLSAKYVKSIESHALWLAPRCHCVERAVIAHAQIHTHKNY